MTLKPLNLPKAKRVSHIIGTTIMLGSILLFLYYSGLVERIGS